MGLLPAGQSKGSIENSFDPKIRTSALYQLGGNTSVIKFDYIWNHGRKLQWDGAIHPDTFAAGVAFTNLTPTFQGLKKNQSVVKRF